MTVKLYSYTGEENRINKTSYLGTATDVTGDQIEGNQNMLTPSIIISSATMPTYNYAYIASYGRYYFIDSVIWIANNTWRLNLRVDVLFTYKTEISNQSGVVQYSTSGSPLRYDPRLVYNKAPTYNSVAPVAGHAVPNPAFVLLRCKYMDSSTPLTDVKRPHNNMIYYIFPIDSFISFGRKYSDVARQLEKTGVAIGKSIVDVTIAFWIDVTGLTTSTFVQFNTPEIQTAYYQETGQPALQGVDISLDSGYSVYVASNFTHLQPKCCTWLIANSAYHYRKALRRIWIPFVGSINADLDKMGLGETGNILLGVAIKYDLTSNSYVLTLGTATLAQPNTLTLYPDTDTVIPNQQTTPFFVDLNVDMAGNQMQSQILNLASNAVSGVTSSIISGGRAAPMALASFGMGLANMQLAQERIEYQQASSQGTVGSCNGGCPDLWYITTSSGSYVYPDARLFITMNPPAAGYATYQTAYGKPDGEYRALSALTGYYQVGEIYLSGMGKATGTERNEIRGLLTSGVIA